jgi:hypothetical protein
MRTKTLLLTAALSAAGIATSMAQVYSVNAVGYVNTPLAKGFNLITNPLDNKAGNTIQNLFGTIPNIMNGFTVYKFANGQFTTPAQYDDLSLDFEPPTAGAQVIAPGEGVFAFNPGPAALTVTFVGDVPQGTLNRDLPKGFSLVGSAVPQAGTVSTLGYTPAEGDVFYQFDEANQKYLTPKSFDLGSWDPAEPSLDVGEAAFVFKETAGSWNRTFNVNQ